MKNQRGFTLIELLAVILIVGVIAVILVPVVEESINKSKEKLYDVQIDNIIKAAKDMVLDNPDLIDSLHINPTLISIEEMQTTTSSKGTTYLEKGTIKNPINEEKMTGTVVITYNEAQSQHIYEYKEETKQSLSSILIIPAATTVMNANKILTNDGDDGLYDDVSENKYIFKGLNPKNYLKIGGNLWRIINIDKTKYTMKIAKISHSTKVVWTTSTQATYAFNNENLKIYTYLNSDFYNALDSEFKDKIVENTTWNIGGISGNIKSVKELKSSEENISQINATVGLLSVGDYISAASNINCRKDFTLGVCSLSNYLVLNKKYFLINTQKSADKIWSVTDENNGGLTLAGVTDELTVIPTVVLKANAEINSGNGSLESPYILNLDK